MLEPLISVCIPVHNGAAYIEENLESVFNQTYTNLEILISDDSSTDHSLSLIRKLKNKSCIIYNQSKRLGWVRNSNFLISQAKGSYFSILTQDDLIPSDYFEKLNNAFKNYKLAVNCYPYIKSIGNRGGQIHQESLLGTLENRIYDVISHHFWAVSFRGLVKNSIPDPLRYLSSNQHLDMMADTVWILQHAIEGELHAVDIPYFKRYHESGEHTTWTKKPIKDKIQAWTQHCASIYSMAFHYVSDHDQLYAACLQRLIEKKQYLVEIKTNEFDHLLLKEFNEKINHAKGKV